MSKSSGFSNARGSRVAAPVMSSTGKPGRERAALELAVGVREAALVLRRRQDAQDLLDRARDLLAVVEDLLPLVGVLREQHHRVADELRHRLRARAAEQAGEARDLDVVEPGLDAVAAVDGHLRQPRDHVVAGVLPLLDRELVEVRRRSR